MYNWYKRKVFIDEKFKDEQLFLTIKKSQYVTRVFVNGHEVGASMECYTPMDFNITSAVKYGSDNEILIQVGDRAWLPSEAAGGTDKEKVHYLPGIWDDVFITATGKMRVDKVLFLPSLAKGLVTVKTLVRSLYPPQMLYGDKMKDSCKIEFCVKEKTTGRIVGKKMIEGEAKRDNRTYFETSISLDNPKAWTPDSPFLYEGEVSVYDQDELVDRYSVNFGMRDFSRKGKFFTLNGDKFYLRGSNITLQRFFEDPDCQALAWDREWVKKLMVDLPKSIDWNAMRICVGIVPDFWYDLCDEYGIVLQNEWLYWQNHGWDEQVRKEYTNWVWSDGNHPSIVIWDAINENWDSYIGNTLIPELKELDPTRIWDAGYMTSDQMGTNDEMDEPHPYRALTLMHSSELNDYFKNNPYNLGALHENWVGFSSILDAGVPQLVNEYGWIWLWRDGRPSKLTLNNYNYYLGENATPEQCRELQAYWLELETEWLRSERSVGGILAFCHLTNNYGFTGDWFINDIKDLEPSPAFRWFKHCFAPSAVFIDLADRRYTKHLEPLKPGSDLVFNLVGVNDLNKESSGKVLMKLLDEKGTIISTQEESIVIEPFGKRLQPCLLKLPSKAGGYLLIAEYHEKGRAKPVLSRRYLKVGDAVTSFKDYFEYTLN
ncbi:glycosyl hydrolase family 2, TIM barrel domain protein [Bacteroides sp. 2_1_33B]|nr:glycosyl hydrolase family 2, TIM barrel domain protein [Bacteroides sp. 2_1_33B]